MVFCGKPLTCFCYNGDLHPGEEFFAPAFPAHTIQVTTADRNVESAVIDYRWDEMGQFLIGSRISLTYQPMQCEKTAWQTWEANSGRVYIRAPTEEEILRHYYSAVYGIEVGNFTRVDSGMMSCLACSVCPLSYHYGVTVNASAMQALLDEGVGSFLWWL